MEDSVNLKKRGKSDERYASLVVREQNDRSPWRLLSFEFLGAGVVADVSLAVALAQNRSVNTPLQVFRLPPQNHWERVRRKCRKTFAGSQAERPSRAPRIS